MGRVGQALGLRTAVDPNAQPSLMDYMLLGSNGVAQRQQMQMRRGEYQQEQAANQQQRTEWGRGNDQYAAVQRFISQLPPNMQNMARVAGPEAVVQMMMPGPWQHDFGRMDRMGPMINADGSPAAPSMQRGPSVPERPNAYFGAGGTDAPPARADNSGVVVTVASPAEAARLPPGTHYQTPNGMEYVR